MTNIRHILTAVSVGLMVCLTACEDLKFGNAFLEKPLSDEVNIDTVFSNKIHAQQALNQVYRSLPDLMPTASSGARPEGRVLDIYSDLGYNSDIPWVSGALNATTGKGALPYNLFSNTEIMGDPFFGIRKAYIYLENVDRVPDMTAEEKNIRKAEMQVIIALHYIQMVRFLGGVPWIDHAYKPDEVFKFPRMTLEETVNRVVAMLDEAASVLPWYTTDAEYGHMTAAAAVALKMRLQLFVASPLFNASEPYYAGEASSQFLTWYGNYDDSRWRAALDSGLEFLRRNQDNQEYYKVYDTDNPRSDYKSAWFDKGNPEVVLPTFRLGVWDKSHKFFRIYGQRNRARASYADMFQWKDGTDFSWDKVNDTSDPHYNQPFFDTEGNPVRDIRLYETLLINGDEYTPGDPLQTWVGAKHGPTKQDQRTYYGYGFRKFIQDYSNGGQLVYNYPFSCPWIRMAEVYLNIAEAMNQLGLTTQPDEFGMDAYDYVNVIRNRAGVADITPDIVPAGDEFTEFILDERAREFGQEDCRYYDIIRYKKGGELLTKPVEKLDITKSGGVITYSPGVNDMEKYLWRDHWYLFPFPVGEINKRYGLIQNPGY